MRLCTAPGSVLLVASGLLLSLGGCAQTRQIDISSGAPREVGNDPSPLIAKSQSKVADLPVPLDFSFQESKSVAQANSHFRYVSHYYRGRAGKERVASFYLDQMPANFRWFKENYRDDRGTLKIDFGKGSERCIVTITEDMWGYTTIHAEIYPVEQQKG
ncbi:MAG: hypothetical protein BIFFINMI_00500 [Phycisphaerae bacterium]|nr:hypothetical protein [Phycisphaerae bacterium]